MEAHHHIKRGNAGRPSGIFSLEDVRVRNLYFKSPIFGQPALLTVETETSASEHLESPIFGQPAFLTVETETSVWELWAYSFHDMVCGISALI